MVRSPDSSMTSPSASRKSSYKTPDVILPEATFIPDDFTDRAPTSSKVASTEKYSVDKQQRRSCQTQLFFALLNAYFFLPLVFCWLPGIVYAAMSRFSFQLGLFNVADVYSAKARNINIACLLFGTRLHSKFDLFPKASLN